jgi:hypothetical protein
MPATSLLQDAWRALSHVLLHNIPGHLEGQDRTPPADNYADSVYIIMACKGDVEA